MGTICIVPVSCILAVMCVVNVCSQLVPCSSASVSTLGWWLGLGSVCQFISAMILGMVKLCHEDYVGKDWHTWLCYVAVIWTACTLVIVGSRILPAFNSFMSEHPANLPVGSDIYGLSSVFFFCGPDRHLCHHSCMCRPELPIGNLGVCKDGKCHWLEERRLRLRPRHSQCTLWILGRGLRRSYV